MRFVRIGAVPMGYAFETREHAARTHRLEIPPNARGETRLYKIYHDIVEFIKHKNGFNQSTATQNKLVVFTSDEYTAMIESMLDQCKDEESNITIEVFSLEELFFALKQKAAQVAGIQTEVRHISISNMLLEEDPYRHSEGFACTVRPCILYTPTSVVAFKFSISTHSIVAVPR